MSLRSGEPPASGSPNERSYWYDQLFKYYSVKVPGYANANFINEELDKARGHYAHLWEKVQRRHGALRPKSLSNLLETYGTVAPTVGDADERGYWFARVHRLFKNHNPSKANEKSVNFILDKANGNYAVMWHKLILKYGAEPEMDEGGDNRHRRVASLTGPSNDSERRQYYQVFLDFLREHDAANATETNINIMLDEAHGDYGKAFEALQKSYLVVDSQTEGEDRDRARRQWFMQVLAFLREHDPDKATVSHVNALLDSANGDYLHLWEVLQLRYGNSGTSVEQKNISKTEEDPERREWFIRLKEFYRTHHPEHADDAYVNFLLDKAQGNYTVLWDTLLKKYKNQTPGETSPPSNESLVVQHVVNEPPMEKLSTAIPSNSAQSSTFHERLRPTLSSTHLRFADVEPAPAPTLKPTKFETIAVASAAPSIQVTKSHHDSSTKKPQNVMLRLPNAPAKRPPSAERRYWEDRVRRLFRDTLHLELREDVLQSLLNSFEDVGYSVMWDMLKQKYGVDPDAPTRQVGLEVGLSSIDTRPTTPETTRTVPELPEEWRDTHHQTTPPWTSQHFRSNAEDEDYWKERLRLYLQRKCPTKANDRDIVTLMNCYRSVGFHHMWTALLREYGPEGTIIETSKSTTGTMTRRSFSPANYTLDSSHAPLVRGRIQYHGLDYRVYQGCTNLSLQQQLRNAIERDMMDTLGLLSVGSTPPVLVTNLQGVGNLVAEFELDLSYCNGTTSMELSERLSQRLQSGTVQTAAVRRAYHAMGGVPTSVFVEDAFLYGDRNVRRSGASPSPYGKPTSFRYPPAFAGRSLHSTTNLPLSRFVRHSNAESLTTHHSMVPPFHQPPYTPFPLLSDVLHCRLPHVPLSQGSTTMWSHPAHYQSVPSVCGQRPLSSQIPVAPAPVAVGGSPLPSPPRAPSPPAPPSCSTCAVHGLGYRAHYMPTRNGWFDRTNQDSYHASGDEWKKGPPTPSDTSVPPHAPLLHASKVSCTIRESLEQGCTETANHPPSSSSHVYPSTEGSPARSTYASCRGAHVAPPTKVLRRSPEMNHTLDQVTIGTLKSRISTRTTLPRPWQQSAIQNNPCTKTSSYLSEIVHALSNENDML